MNNPCVRCGKQRVDQKSWKGKAGASVITYTLTVCPDAECQKIVDKGIADKKAKSAQIADDRVKAKLAREKLLAVRI